MTVREEWSLRVVPTAKPELRAHGEGASTLGLEAIREGFEAGAVQAVFLGLPDVTPTSPSPERALSQDEREYAARIGNPNVAGCFIAGRWLLRSVLSALLGMAPAAISLQKDERGKPSVLGAGASAPSFNISHSGGLVALALAPKGRVGIDVEEKRPLVDAERLAQRILTAREAAGFRALPESAREDALLTAWTRKEAVLKAIGTGIAGSPESIDVHGESDPASDQLVVISPDDPQTRWSLRALAMPAGFYGALAIEGAIGRLLTWQAVPTRRNEGSRS
jgi:4'-phosphopantetheinyl transferase